MRLKKESLAVTVCDKNIYEITSMSIRDLQKFLDDHDIDETAAAHRRAES